MSGTPEPCNGIPDQTDEVVPAMEELRQSIDALELLVDKDVWPVPTYGDLMFEV